MESSTNRKRSSSVPPGDTPQETHFERTDLVKYSNLALSSSMTDKAFFEAELQYDKETLATGGSPLVDVIKGIDGIGVQKPTLMTLPTELRLQILELLLIASHGRIQYDRPLFPSPPYGESYIKYPSSGNVSPRHAKPGIKIDLWPSILATCWQIYEEAWPLLYYRNTLQFSGWADALNFFHPKFQRRTSEIRHLALRTDCYNMGLVQCAKIISSFANLKTVEIEYDSVRSSCMLNGMNHYEKERDSQQHESPSEQREAPRRDQVIRNSGLEQLKTTWIHYFATTAEKALASRLEEALRARIAQMSSREGNWWAPYSFREGVGGEGLYATTVCSGLWQNLP